MILLKNIPLNTLTDLRNALQTAIELEHSTIPPYLTANFTLFNTGNDQIANIIGSVAGEEMLHMSIASNLLNAIGGKPQINNPSFVPCYPGPLPGGVQSGLQVSLEKFSKDLIKDVFMEIEEPENPIVIQSFAVAEAITIGQFYTRIKELILALDAAAKAKGDTIFTGSVKDQVTFEKFYPLSLLFPVTNQDEAIHAINIIIDQGEGTATNPFENPSDDAGINEPAHYYRFEEIYVGKTLEKKADGTFAWGDPPVLFNNPEQIPNMWPNPKMNNYPRDSQAYINSRIFNATYTSLLNCLHQTFNGQPDQISTALGLMFSLQLYALKLLAIPDPNHPGYVAGPSFEYVVG